MGERRAPGAEVSKGTSPRAVDADVLDINWLWIQKIDFIQQGRTGEERRAASQRVYKHTAVSPKIIQNIHREKSVQNSQKDKRQTERKAPKIEPPKIEDIYLGWTIM